MKRLRFFLIIFLFLACSEKKPVPPPQPRPVFIVEQVTQEDEILSSWETSDTLWCVRGMSIKKDGWTYCSGSGPGSEGLHIRPTFYRFDGAVGGESYRHRVRLKANAGRKSRQENQLKNIPIIVSP